MVSLYQRGSFSVIRCPFRGWRGTRQAGGGYWPSNFRSEGQGASPSPPAPSPTGGEGEKDKTLRLPLSPLWERGLGGEGKPAPPPIPPLPRKAPWVYGWASWSRRMSLGAGDSLPEAAGDKR